MFKKRVKLFFFSIISVFLVKVITVFLRSALEHNVNSALYKYLLLLFKETS